MNIKNLFTTLGALIIGITLYAQSSNQNKSLHNAIQIKTDEIFDSLVTIRRDFHKHPELSGKEHRTSNEIAQYLRSLGLEVKTNIGGYGVVGILNGDKPGKRIAWRADIDALETNFPDVVNFKSQNKGVRHMCGHDVHTTIGLGIANVLSSQRDKIKGTVYFIFQPSEENFKGAKSMIDDDLFKIISPEEIYGTHIYPMPTGYITAKPDLVYAYMKVLKVVFKKTAKRDAITKFIKKNISSFQNVSPGSKFFDSRNLGDPQIGIGGPNSIFKNYLTVSNRFKNEEKDDLISLKVLLNGTNKNRLDSIPTLLNKIINRSEYAQDLVSIEYSREYPAVINDASLTKSTLNSLSEIFGKQNIIPSYGLIPNFNDDFSYFQQHIPGVYFFLGGSNFNKGQISMPHSPNFSVDEESIKIGVKYFSSMITERINNQ
jgi:metal-dependent amidase/aminoacylase/carboxypeptidase family protein